VPEKRPLQRLVTLEVVLEAEKVLLVVLLQEVEHLSRRLVTWKRRVLCVVYEHGDAAWSRLV